MKKSCDASRFWSKVDKAAACWQWQGSKFTTGYGAFSIGGKNRAAHRVAYELTHGAIEGGLHICHSCDNRLCVNPLHLFSGTRSDNMRDMVSKGRGGGSAKGTTATHCKNKHKYRPETTYLHKGRRHCKLCNRDRVNEYQARKKNAA